MGRRGPLAQLAPEKLEYLLALHSFFLGRPLPDGTYDLEPRDHSPALIGDPRGVPPLPADGRAAPRDAAAGGALPPLPRKPAATGTSSSPGTSRSSPRACTTTSATAPARYLADRPTQRARRLAAGDLRHPRGRRRAAPGRRCSRSSSTSRAAATAPASARAPRTVGRRGRSSSSTRAGRCSSAARPAGGSTNRPAAPGTTGCFSSRSPSRFEDFLRHPEGEALVSQSSIQLLLKQLDGQRRQPIQTGARADRRGSTRRSARCEPSKANTRRRSCATAAAAAG